MQHLQLDSSVLDSLVVCNSLVDMLMMVDYVCSWQMMHQLLRKIALGKSTMLQQCRIHVQRNSRACSYVVV